MCHLVMALETGVGASINILHFFCVYYDRLLFSIFYARLSGASIFEEDNSANAQVPILSYEHDR